MPFQIRQQSALVDQGIPKERIAGAYYRLHRRGQKRSLIALAKELRMNKGFLSDLENGKRHFPEGTVSQINEILNVSFDEDQNLWRQAREDLFQLFEYFFFEQTERICSKYEEIQKSEEERLHSYGFFVSLMIKLFYFLRIVQDDEKVRQIKMVIDQNLNCLQNDELAVYYCLLGIFYKRNTMDNPIALDCFLKSGELCNPNSHVHAMNTFQLISVYAELNQPVIAYKKCLEAREVLKLCNNYSRLITVDMFECVVLTDLRLFLEAKEKLLHLLVSSNNEYLNYPTGQIYHNLAWNALLSENYEECIQYAKRAKLEKDSSPDLCYYVPFSLFKLNRVEEAFKACEKAEEEECDTSYRLFLRAIKDRINGQDEQFEHSILAYYQSLLENKRYEDISFIQDFMLDYFEEKENTIKIVQVVRDIRLYMNHQLDRFTTCLGDFS
ncbi:helix-turn-helix domain-containing protein [uncultured Dubosiella sp.]|uniref:helix-turn-helix domain-containing protein n=2 Tax=uncultured Dubosiella sp. TaxID=1937011 RepID=UPI002596FBA9|nr:helix-turn-helix transcriptional regulator [uncultured Dubosiella sp.]